MKLDKIRVAYPQILYEIKVTHYTERKSTAQEWLLLEIADKAEHHSDYNRFPLEDALNLLFSISDSDILLRQVLIDLIDAGALEQIDGLSDKSEWRKICCGDLRLTDNGRRLQKEGKLPAKSQINTMEVIYDVVERKLRAATQKDKSLPDSTSSVKAADISADNMPGFPEVLVRELIQRLQQKEKNALTWLQPNSSIDTVIPSRAQIRWKNVSCNITADSEGIFSLQEESNSEVLRAVFEQADFGASDEENLPVIRTGDLAEKINIQPYNKAEGLIRAAISKTETFFIGEQFANVLKGADKKNCLIPAQPEFAIENADGNLLVKIPSELREGLCYQDRERTICAANLELHFENMTRYVPCVYETGSELESNLIKLVKEYSLRDFRILKLLDFVGAPPYSDFYTEDLLRQKLNSPESEAVTPVDKILNRLLTLSQKVTNILPVSADYKQLRRALIEKGRDILVDVHDWTEQWREDIDSLRKKFGLNLNSIDWRESSFGEALAQMNRAAEAVKIFYDTAASNYRKVYVMDTSALMHVPHILDDFANGRAMVVVPEFVFEALDDFQESDDEKIQNASRKVVQKLGEYENCPWLKLHEETVSEPGFDADEGEAISAALKYLVKTLVLVTDDAKIQALAASKGIETVAAQELHQNLSGSSHGKKKKKGKK